MLSGYYAPQRRWSWIFHSITHIRNRYFLWGGSQFANPSIRPKNTSFLRQLFKPLLGHTRFRDRCWAAIRLPHRLELSDHAVHGEVDGLDIGGQHGRRFVLMPTFTGRRGGHTPFVHTGAETSDTGAKAVKLDPGLFLVGSFWGGCRCRGWKYGVLWGFPPTPHSIGDLPTALHVCCYCQMNWWDVVRRVQMDVSIWGAVLSHSMDGWALSGADVQAPWHGVPETVWLHCDEARQLGCLWGLEGCPLV